MKIYEIPSALRTVLDDAYVDEDTGELIFDAEKFAEVCESAEAKIANCGRYIREQEHEIEAMKKASQDIMERAKAKQKKLDWLIRSTVASINALGRPVDETDIRVSTRKSESVEVDEAVLGREWFTESVSYKPNKVALKHALKNGEPVEGACLVTNFNLSIK